jgi:hypothetical protein
MSDAVSDAASETSAWTCSYVMHSGNGVNLLGTLDVDENRARFVASSGLFGTAYQFVMPRDQIQILRVPTASTPYNALELHTKYRQNILCDFDDNERVFRKCVEVMKLEVLPQESPLIAVLGTDVSEAANKWRRRAAQKKLERDEQERRKNAEADEGQQLTAQVMHLHGEKATLQRRMRELERENEHLHGEVEVLYAQVDEVSERIERDQARYAEAAIEAFVASGRERDAAERREEDECAARSRERATGGRGDDPLAIHAVTSPTNDLRVKTRRESAGGEKDGGSAGGSGTKRPPAHPNSASPKGAGERGAGGEERGGTPRARPETPGSAKSHASSLAGTSPRTLEARHEELVESVVALRAERASLEAEVARLRDDFGSRGRGGNDAGNDPREEDEEDAMHAMLAKEVQHLLSRQAELANNLAQVRREKELLESENELLHAKKEEVETEVEEAKAEAERVRQASARYLALRDLEEEEEEEEKHARAGFDESANGIHLSEEENTSPGGSRSAAGGSVKAAAKEKGQGPEGETKGPRPNPNPNRKKKVVVPPPRSSPNRADRSKIMDDGPDAELAAKLIGRLQRAGESDEARALESEMEAMKAELDVMRREREAGASGRGSAAAFGQTAAAGTALSLDSLAALEAKARALEATLEVERKTHEDAMAREREEALWRVTEAELRAKDAESALGRVRARDAEKDAEIARLRGELESRGGSEGGTSPATPPKEGRGVAGMIPT